MTHVKDATKLEFPDNNFLRRRSNQMSKFSISQNLKLNFTYNDMYVIDIAPLEFEISHMF